MHDLVIRDAFIVDGTGTPGFAGDVAIDGARLVQVGGKAGRGRRELAAAGRLVTPGFVDLHTHYDGQVAWDSALAPSSWHGVTTAVMGNCSVGFAPARADAHDGLIRMMEAIEDIPAETLTAGLPWGWESFGEYLDVLDRMPRAIDIGAQVTHAALRTYVMGERGIANEPANADDLERMRAIVRDAMRAGALGFTTSRATTHRSGDGKRIPGNGVAVDEVIALGRVLGELGQGVIGLNVDFIDIAAEVAWLRRLQRETGRPVWFLLVQFANDPQKYSRILEQMTRAADEGEPLYAEVCARPVGFLLGLEGSRHPFIAHPSYVAIAELPLAERVARLRDPAFRAQLLSERPEARGVIMKTIVERFDLMFRLGDPPDYEPLPEGSVAAQAAREGRTPAEVALDTLLERDGQELIFMPGANYAAGDFSDIERMLAHPKTVMGLSDAGAHCGLICDASIPTFMLTHWVRDRRRGPKLALERAVRSQTLDTATFYGLCDRGVLRAGAKADLNVIDFERLALRPPEMIRDFPAGGRRLVQRAAGYGATVVSGEVTLEDDTPTGALPGRLVRGSRPE